LFRAALTASATDHRFRERRLATLQFCAERQKEFLLTRSGELGCADPARGSDLMFERYTAVLDHELLFGHFTTTASLDDADLERELVEQSFFALGISAEQTARA